MKLEAALDSNFRSSSHKVVVLGNLSVSRLLGTPWASESGNCRATETTEGERESRTNSSFAPEESPESRKVREMSTCLLLFLLGKGVSCGSRIKELGLLEGMLEGPGAGLYTYFNPY